MDGVYSRVRHSLSLAVDYVLYPLDTFFFV